MGEKFDRDGWLPTKTTPLEWILVGVMGTLLAIYIAKAVFA